MCKDPTEQNPIHVVVADSTRIHSQLLADVMKRDHRIQVVGVVTSAHDLLETVAKLPVDVAVVSSKLDEEPSRGLEVLRELRSLRSTVRVIMLLDSSSSLAVVEAFRAGAKGIFSKLEPIKNLCKCVRSVHEGQVWVSHNALNSVVEALATAPEIRAVDANGINLLSKRELDVVRCLAEGLTNSEIGERLGLSKHTVKNYLLRIFDKIGVSNRMELLFFTLSQPESIAKPSQEKREEEELEVCRKAAERGLPGARVELANYYLQGNGVAPDPVSAYMWFLLSETACLEMRNQIVGMKEKIAESMTAEQILDAERKAAAWPKQAKKPSVHNGIRENMSMTKTSSA
jgi:DNA-binding NarL/FixJ family response regulator